eukprot:281650-Pelagomonas_calceolata.AAC.2
MPFSVYVCLSVTCTRTTMIGKSGLDGQIRAPRRQRGGFCRSSFVMLSLMWQHQALVLQRAI